MPEPTGSSTELLVYLSSRSDSSLLGAIFVDPKQTITDTIAQISEEIDNVPAKFAVHRHNGKVSVPVNKKQMGLRVIEHFKDNDAIVIVPLTSPYLNICNKEGIEHVRTSEAHCVMPHLTTITSDR